ncbi:MAG: response regulator transcription factor [Candidatus Nanopelagicales bacterium]
MAGTATGSDPLRVLVIEDEDTIRRVVVGYLEQEGYQVTEAADGHLGVDLARSESPDVLVLDVGLPGIDGIEVCRQVRVFTDAYIIMLTARSDEVDKLIGLSVGADDYLTKPFSPRELVARIKVMLRRPRVQPDADDVHVRVFGELRVDPESREVTLAGEPVDFTRTEFDILDVLSANPRRVHSRARLVDEVWGQGWVGDERVVDVHVAHIRSKLGEDVARPQYLLTVRGVGFKMGPG